MAECSIIRIPYHDAKTPEKWGCIAVLSCDLPQLLAFIDKAQDFRGETVLIDLDNLKNERARNEEEARTTYEDIRLKLSVPEIRYDAEILHSDGAKIAYAVRLLMLAQDFISGELADDVQEYLDFVAPPAIPGSNIAPTGTGINEAPHPIPVRLP